MKKAKATRTAWGYYDCDCDPFIKFFLDGNDKFTTRTQGTNEFNVDYEYTTPKINKTSVIRIEMWDYNRIIPNYLIFITKGNVDSFLRDGHRKEVYEHHNILTRNFWTTTYENYIDTVSFWQDEYDYDDV